MLHPALSKKIDDRIFCCRKNTHIHVLEKSLAKALGQSITLAFDPGIASAPNLTGL